MAWLTAAAVVIAMLALTGTAVVAASLHRAYSLGWVGATAASTLFLLLPLALETRTVVALLCGPLAGIAIHLAALVRAPLDAQSSLIGGMDSLEEARWSTGNATGFRGIPGAELP
jgi:hypothetical protein